MQRGATPPLHDIAVIERERVHGRGGNGPLSILKGCDEHRRFGQSGHAQRALAIIIGDGCEHHAVVMQRKSGVGLAGRAECHLDHGSGLCAGLHDIITGETWCDLFLG